MFNEFNAEILRWLQMENSSSFQGNCSQSTIHFDEIQFCSLNLPFVIINFVEFRSERSTNVRFLNNIPSYISATNINIENPSKVNVIENDNQSSISMNSISN